MPIMGTAETGLENLIVTHMTSSCWIAGSPSDFGITQHVLGENPDIVASEINA